MLTQILTPKHRYAWALRVLANNSIAGFLSTQTLQKRTKIIFKQNTFPCIFPTNISNPPKNSPKSTEKTTEMEHQTGALMGSGTTSDTSIKQEEEAPLMQERVTVERQIMKVMVALDESDGSFYALNWAFKNLVMGKKLTPISGDEGGVSLDEECCMVYLVHVQHSFQNYVYPVGPGLHTAAFAASTVVESVKQAQAEISATILERALSFCRHNKVRAETLILEGDPKEEICKAIEQMHVDMLVIGSRSLGQIKRAFLGSVSDYCAHHASCPVLIVKSPKDAHLSISTK